MKIRKKRHFAMTLLQWLNYGGFVRMVSASPAIMFTNKATVFFDDMVYCKISTRHRGLLKLSMKIER